VNKKLYVSNLAFNVDKAKLESLFAADGRKVASVQIPTDKLTGRSKGFGFIEMTTFEHAASAIQALNGHEFMGRPLIVKEAGDRK
jgi:cold-inducible RNA-binding protein